MNFLSRGGTKSPMETIINKAISKSTTSFKIYSLSINLYDQTYALFPCTNTLLKEIPKNIKFTALPENIIITETKIAGIESDGGTSSILFYPDGTKEYAKLFVTDLSKKENYEIIINPYSLSSKVYSYE